MSLLLKKREQPDDFTQTGFLLLRIKICAPHRAVKLVRSLPMKSRQRLVRDVFVIFTTHKIMTSLIQITGHKIAALTVAFSRVFCILFVYLFYFGLVSFFN